MNLKFFNFMLFRKAVTMCSFLIVFVCVQAQVGINTEEPDINAALDVCGNNHLGMLPPKVNLTSTADRAPLSAGNALTEGMIVYNVNAAITGAGADGIGLYIWSGALWGKLVQSNRQPKWFYMPTVPVDVSANRHGVVLDLYAEYKRLFMDNTAATATSSNLVLHTNNPTFASTNAPSLPATIVTFAATDLYYYVIGYDETVFTLTNLDSNGVLTFDINSANVSDLTYMDVVFVVK